ncbi:MAG: sugar phosphate isomerase/epimerase [Bifidobacterium sp.]|nr:sugar phosphate isomerase/epimerase [Bifidobacterium sp.]
MRIGIGTTLPHNTPGKWAATLQSWGCTAAVCPIDHTAPADLRKDYLDAASAAGLSITEVGVWKNVMSPDEDHRRKAIEYAEAQLALADEIGARCCVNIAGNAGPGGWDQYSPQNYSGEAYERIVDTTREIIDAVRPVRTRYALECMPWMLPDSPESYLKLLKDVDRDHMGVHLDYTNMINGMGRWRTMRSFIDSCFSILGGRILSIHAKDVRLMPGLPTSIVETEPGTGAVDYAQVLSLAARFAPRASVFTEHLDTPRQYRDAVAYLLDTAGRVGAAR